MITFSAKKNLQEAIFSQITCAHYKLLLNTNYNTEICTYKVNANCANVAFCVRIVLQ